MAATTETTENEDFLGEWEYLSNTTDLSEDTGNYIPEKLEDDE